MSVDRRRRGRERAACDFPRGIDRAGVRDPGRGRGLGANREPRAGPRGLAAREPRARRARASASDDATREERVGRHRARPKRSFRAMCLPKAEPRTRPPGGANAALRGASACEPARTMVCGRKCVDAACACVDRASVSGFPVRSPGTGKSGGNVGSRHALHRSFIIIHKFLLNSI